VNIKGRPFRSIGLFFLTILVFMIGFRVYKEGILSSQSGINLVVVGDTGCSLLVLRPDEDIVGWVDFPDKLKIKIYNSLAQYPIVSLWDYGVAERRPIEIIERSLGLSMGVVISRAIKVDGTPSVETVLGSLHKVNLKTDLSFRDRFLIRKYLSDAVDSKKILEMEIPGNVLDKITEPDGKEFLVFNNVTALWTKNKFLLETILNENVDASINNLSGLAGLGISVSKQLESAGIRVVEVKTDPGEDVEGSGCIFVSHGNYPITENFLLRQMNCEKRRSVKELNKKGIDIWLK